MKERKVALPINLKLSEQVFATYCVKVEQGVTREDLLRLDFWAHVAAKLKPWTIIVVHPDDESFYAEYLVRAADKNWARVQEIRFVSLVAETKTDPSVLENYEVKLRGPRRWGVIRKADNKVLVEDLANKEDAENWLALYLKNPNMVSVAA